MKAVKIFVSGFFAALLITACSANNTIQEGSSNSKILSEEIEVVTQEADQNSNYIYFPPIERLIKAIAPTKSLIEHGKSLIFEHYNDQSRYMMRFENKFIYNNREIGLSIYLKPKPELSFPELDSILPTAELIRANAGFGMGSEVSLIRSGEDIMLLETSDGRRVKRFISSWGSGVSRDLTGYLIHLESNNRYFDEVLVNFIDVWPDTSNVPEDLSNTLVKKLSTDGDPRVEIYEVLDEFIRSIEIF